jgi:hypothetical protein
MFVFQFDGGSHAHKVSDMHVHVKCGVGGPCGSGKKAKRCCGGELGSQCRQEYGVEAGLPR